MSGTDPADVRDEATELWHLTERISPRDGVEAIAQALDAARAEGARQALNDAADDWWKPGRPHRPVQQWLRDRAVGTGTAQ